jgi:hypothetical protein
MSYSKFNPYGFRKGAATHAVSGTTALPSMSSVARWWGSIGSVLDVYWHFASVGDHHLGRILAGLDLSEATFATLLPHWIMTNPMSTDIVKKAMDLMYGPIIKRYDGTSNSPVPMMYCLSCIVHHSGALIAIMERFPRHDSAKLGLLQDRRDSSFGIEKACDSGWSLLKEQ